MWVAAETINDYLVPQLEVQVRLQAKRLEEWHGGFMDDRGLAVHVRYVKEEALIWGERLVVSTGYGLLSKYQGDRVSSVGERGSSVHVPRELV